MLLSIRSGSARGRQRKRLKHFNRSRGSGENPSKTEPLRLVFANGSFGVIACAGASYLVGDAADSPVTEKSHCWRPAGCIALSYRF